MTKDKTIDSSNIMSDIVTKLQISKNKVFHKRQLYYALGYNQKDISWGDFEKAFYTLLKADVIKSNKNKKIKLTYEDIFIGKIFFSPKGYAFVHDLHTESANYYVSKSNTGNAFHEDIVVAKICKEEKTGKKAEAKVLITLSHTITELVGTFEKSEHFGFVRPDNLKFNADIYIPNDCCNKAMSFEKVFVKIERFVPGKNPIGRIVEILGAKGDKDAESLSVIKENGLRDQFPPGVKKEAMSIKPFISQEEIDKRVDFRDRIIFTIDGKDAKDLDDAISIEKLKDGYKLGVYIADVAHYVKEGSEIDKEAIERGTSVYLLDRVIPMLPNILCNNVCSLNRDTEKLVLACEMKIDFNGNVVNSTISEGIITSKGRLNYEDVNLFLAGEFDDFAKEYPEIAIQLKTGIELADILRNKRKKEGSLEFDRPETKVVLNEDGKVVSISPYPRGVSNDMIEEFMLITNQTVSKTFYENNIPFLYRIHDYPRKEKLEVFLDVAKKCGLDLSIKNTECANPVELKELMESIKDDPSYDALSLMLLRSMQQAKYSPIKSIHFGLSFEFYSHFTSPIRRYPDLQIHRIIKEYLHGKMSQNRKMHYLDVTTSIATKASKKERLAEKAEKDLKLSKIIEYLNENTSEVFDATITSFNKGGIFVSLDNTVSGYVKINNFNFDEANYTGQANNESFKLGQKIKVSPVKANINNQEVTFRLVRGNENE